MKEAANIRRAARMFPGAKRIVIEARKRLREGAHAELPEIDALLSGELPG
jgi:hypothetical protein